MAVIKRNLEPLTTSELKQNGVPPPTTEKVSGKVWFYLVLLTIQYGAQPLISKRCIKCIQVTEVTVTKDTESKCVCRDNISNADKLARYARRSSASGLGEVTATDCMKDLILTLYVQAYLPCRREVIVTSSVLACEVAKVTCALFLIMKEGNLKKMYKEWTLIGALTASGLPAAIYALQNSLLQISYKNLDSLTFSMLNQTKLLFTAFFTYLILRQKQSVQQIGGLVLLILAAVLLSVGEGTGSSGSDADLILFHGIIPVLVASVLSGLASSLCQWASQVKKHSSYLMTVEMSVVGSLCLLASTYKSPDGEQIRKHGFFYGWTAFTLIPVLTNAVGGILVGLVTAHAGGGFVIVSALLVTALLQFIFDGKPPSIYCLLALPLVISSISIYQKYPYKLKKKERKLSVAQNKVDEIFENLISKKREYLLKGVQTFDLLSSCLRNELSSDNKFLGDAMLFLFYCRK
ncbi:hypothetical protein C5167_017741 [Papaver somniferum]|uniref:Uncharacterized protein n=1 Tax=Papaver somniferum TaxID=3469 RepID=A0A4Y7IPC8_PAPSO|nr:hypothetical protein C5167_017741 [Papaver somniferum]